MDDFSLTLLSSSSTEIYENTLSSFTNLLSSQINLSGNWVVGLSEIYINKLNYIERSKRDIQCENLKGYTEELKKIKELMEEFLKTEEEKSKTGEKPKRKRSDIPNLFDYIDSIFHPIKDLTDRLIEQSNTLIQLISNKNNIIEHAFLYSDIIQPRGVGDKQTKCLKVIPIKNNESYIHFEKVDYFPVESNILKDISILITNGAGEKIDFKASMLPTFLTLHFKKNI